ncbi:MAG: hypothetical protein ABI175_26435, partial [Polyangiales bacterium]
MSGGVTRLISMKCPECGAALPPREECGTYRCEFCESTFEARRAANVHVQTPLPMPAYPYVPPQQPHYPPPIMPFMPTHVHVRPTGNAAGVILGVVVGLLLFAGIGVAVFIGAVTRGIPRPPGPSSKTAAEEPPAVAKRFMYDGAGGDPLPVRHGEDEWFLARFRAGDADGLVIAAIDSATMKEKWRTKEFGDYSAGYTATFYASVGNRVFVSDYKAIVHVLDLDKGKEKATFKLSDRAKWLCGSPSGDAVWVEVSDEKDVMVDATTLAMTAAKRPAWCPTKQSGPSNAWYSVQAKFKGFSARRTFFVGDDGAAIGGKSPGTSYPMAVGFDPVTKAPRWTVTLAAKESELAADRAAEDGALGFGVVAVAYWQSNEQT